MDSAIPATVDAELNAGRGAALFVIQSARSASSGGFYAERRVLRPARGASPRSCRCKMKPTFQATADPYVPVCCHISARTWSTVNFLITVHVIITGGEDRFGPRWRFVDGVRRHGAALVHHSGTADPARRQ